MIVIVSGLLGLLYGLVLTEGVQFGLLNGLLNGVMIGSLDILWVRRRRGRRLRQLPLWANLLALTLIWSVIISANMTLTRHWLGLEHGLHLRWLWQVDFWRHFLFCLVMAFTLNLLLRLVALTGRQELVDILLGRYQEPRQEQRVFLFLDVVNSTGLTEKVGDVMAYKLIGELFFELAGIVDRFGGDIHRYIGDEMVVTWRLSPGQQMPDVIGCLVAVFAAVDLRRTLALDDQAGALDLRAGINAGPVVICEIGDRKRELVYFGDAINVAAGLQAYGKQSGHRALIHRSLYQLLLTRPGVGAEPLSGVVLKGRKAPLECLALSF